MVDLSSPMFRDELTGLPNRRGLHRFLESGIPWTSPREPVSIALFDIDGFKSVNDAIGDVEGDKILASFGDWVREFSSPDDVSGRYGGDSFMLILPGSDKARAAATLEKYREALHQRNPSLTISGGIAGFPDDAVTAVTLLDKVQRAFFVAKQSGKNRVDVAGRLDERVAAGRDKFATIPCPVFVNREDELRTSMVLLDQLRRKRPGVLWIQGGPGAGKSRLLRHIRERVRSVNIPCLAATCTESKRDVPGHPLLQIISRHYEMNPEALEDLRGRFNSVQQTVLGGLIPAFAAWRTAGETQAPNDRKFLIAESLREILCAMAADSPVLLQVDNAEFVDVTTLEILASAIGEYKAGIAVIFAGEGDVSSLDPERAVAATRLFDSIPSSLTPRSATMAPLNPKALASMVSAILPGAVISSDFSAAITEASRGNPHYVEEALRAMLLSGKIQRSGSDWSIGVLQSSDLQASLDEMIQKSIALLTAESREVLSHAAILDWPFDLQTLQELLGLSKPRVLDAIDQARLVSIIRPMADSSREEFEFVAGHTRTVLTRSLEDRVRRRIHRRLANLLKLRAMDQPGTHERDISFHTERAEGESTLRPRPADAPAPAGPAAPRSDHLTPMGVNRCIEFLRLFLGLIRLRRLYPQWAGAGDTLRLALVSTASVLFEEVSTIVFTPGPAQLMVNGEPLDTEQGGDVAPEVMKLFETRRIESMSFHSGLEEAEIDTLLGGLVDPSFKGATPRWEQLLNREDVRHIEVRPGSRKDRDYETVRLRRAELAPERALSPREVNLFWDAMCMLQTSASHLKQYPPGTPLVEEAMHESEVAIERLLEKSRIVTLVASATGLLVNGEPATPQGESDATVSAFLSERFQERRLKKLTFMHGTSGEEVRAVVSFFSVEDHPLATRVLEVNETPHVTFAFDSQVSPSDMAMPAVGSASDDMYADFEPIPLNPVDSNPKPMMVRIDLRARTLLVSPIDHFLSEKTEKEFTPTIEVLHFGRLNSQAEELLNRLVGCLAESKPDWRRQAVNMVNRALLESNDTKDLVFEKVRAPLAGCIRMEKDPAVLKSLAESIRILGMLMLTRARIPMFADFLALTLKPKLDDPNVPRDFKAAAVAKLHTLATHGPANPAVEALKNGTDTVRQAAVQVLRMLGPAMTAPVMDIIRASENPNLRALAARAIQVGTETDMGKLVKIDTPTEDLVRILEVLDQSGTANLATAILTALGHNDIKVHHAAFKVVKRIDRGVAVAVLRKVMAMTRPEILQAGLALARDMKISELGSEVVKLAADSEDDNLVRAACDYLGEFPSLSAVPALRRIFQSRSKVFGLLRGFSDETRAAAVLAALRINHPTAKDLVTQAAGDKSEIVRRMVKPGKF